MNEVVRPSKTDYEVFAKVVSAFRNGSSVSMVYGHIHQLLAEAGYFNGRQIATPSETPPEPKTWMPAWLREFHCQCETTGEAAGQCVACQAADLIERGKAKTDALCPHGFVLRDNTCGPCSKGEPNRKKAVAPPEASIVKAFKQSPRRIVEHQAGCWKLQSPSGQGVCNCGAENGDER